jgi:hypothetical protein
MVSCHGLPLITGVCLSPDRNLRNLCNLRIHLSAFICGWVFHSRKFAACRAVGLAKADAFAVKVCLERLCGIVLRCILERISWIESKRYS